LFRRKPEILQRYQERYLHLMVDEFQDTNLVQYELVKQIGGKYRNSVSWATPTNRFIRGGQPTSVIF